jgi:nucleotide-binding universal stress UspA family protein
MLKILYATDGSASAAAALGLLERLALTANDQVRVLSVVAQPLPGATVGVDLATGAWEVLADLQGREQALLEEAATQAVGQLADRGLAASAEQRHGDPAHEILRAAEEWEADLIVVGAQGLTGLERFLLGSVAHNVAKHARRPVLVARAPAHGFRRVVVATDGSDHAQNALEFVSRLPLPAETGCVVANVVRPYTPFPGLLPTDRTEFEAAVREVNHRHCEAAVVLTDEGAALLTQSGKHARPEVREGDPAEEILRMAENGGADLIAVGARGVSLIQGLLVGSVTDRLLKSAVCSVLVVP